MKTGDCSRRKILCRTMLLCVPTRFRISTCRMRAPYMSSSTIKNSVSLIGEASSPGFYKGRACIIKDPEEEEEKLQYGDVLVCRFAEGKWNSLITNAGALVCEMGGKISHGPMIARRIGIPCVSNFPNSLWDYIEDGDEVVVRGNLGTLEILGKSEIPGKLLQNPPEDDKDIQMTMTQEEFQEKLKLAQTTGKE